VSHVMKVSCYMWNKTLKLIQNNFISNVTTALVTISLLSSR